MRASGRRAGWRGWGRDRGSGHYLARAGKRLDPYGSTAGGLEGSAGAGWGPSRAPPGAYLSSPRPSRTGALQDPLLDLPF